MERSDITVRRPVLADPYTVRYEVDCSAPMRAYLSSRPMFVRYDADVSAVPEQTLLVPFLGSVAPIAWILGARLRVPVADASFLASLQAVRESLRRMYPALRWAGAIDAEAVVDGVGSSPGRTALLFSGGVDSLASYVRHRHESPLLVSVWGADVGLGQRRDWEHVRTANRAFARDHGLDIAFVTSNFRIFFNHYKLRARFLESFPNWYSAAQQGLGLVTLCAPLSHTHAVRRVLISASHTPDWDRPWGTHPSIDSRVRWGTTAVSHDGYELTRQMKVRLLADFIRSGDGRLPIRVCWGRAPNCSHCVKCAMTMIGLAVEGVDPNAHGFRCDTQALARIRRGLETGRMYLSDSAEWRWHQIQARIPNRTYLDIDGLDDFLAWLATVSIRDCKERFGTRRRARARRYLESRPEPLGRWLRWALRHPFP